MDDRDKREFFRLDDTIQLSYCRVSNAQIRSSQPEDFFTTDPNFHLLNALYQLQTEADQQISNISKQSRQMGVFAANLDKRLELVAQVLIRSLGIVGEERNAQLSEQGISFDSAEALPIDEPLALQLVLSSQSTPIHCFARVRNSRRLRGANYRLGVEFMGLDTAKGRSLRRYIMRRQAEGRRAQRPET